MVYNNNNSKSSWNKCVCSRFKIIHKLWSIPNVEGSSSGANININFGSASDGTTNGIEK